MSIKDGLNGSNSTADGVPVNAIRTFVMMIMNLRRNFPSDKMLIAFDERGGHTHRHQHDFYKAGRSKQPDELHQQMPFVREFLTHYGIPHHSEKEYEADDIIGILAKRAKNDGFAVDIVTTDKDLLQLVDHDVDVYISIKGVTEMVKHTMSNFADLNYGLRPMQITDYKGIAGDTSDNLVGVKGIGDKGAIKLILEYDSLEEIMDNLDSLPLGIKSKLEEHREIAKLCKSLATILTEGNIDVELEKIDMRNPNWDMLEAFLNEMPMKSVKESLLRQKDEWK